jgi:Fe-S oxidoreductase
MRLFAFLNKWGPLILSGFKGKMGGHQNSLQIKQKCLKKQRVFIKLIIFIQQCLLQILQYPDRTSLISQSNLLNDLCSVANRGAAYSCTGCRRCVVFCPFGIDTQMIMSIAKLLLVGAHAEPEILTLLADTSITKGDALVQ